MTIKTNEDSRNLTAYLLLTVLLIVSNPQLTIYHKYYDPLLLIMFFTMFNLKFYELSLKKYLIFFVYLITFLGVSIIYYQS